MSTRNTAKLCSLTVERIYKTNIAKKMGKQKRRSRSRREEEFPWSICVCVEQKRNPFHSMRKRNWRKKVAVKWKQNFTASVLFASSPLSDSWEMSTLSIAAKLRQHFPHELTHADVCLLAVCTCVVMEAVTLSPPPQHTQELCTYVHHAHATMHPAPPPTQWYQYCSRPPTIRFDGVFRKQTWTNYRGFV